MAPFLGLVVALPAEGRALVGRKGWRRIDGRPVCQGQLADGTTLLCVCSGVGPDNALAAARWLVGRGARALVVVGVAGGLAGDLKTGELLLAETVLEDQAGHLSEPRVLDPRLIRAARNALQMQGLAFRIGRLLTSHRPVPAVVDKQTLHQQSRALAVDMETAAVARSSREAGLPFLCLRSICDAADRAVPQDLLACLDKQGRIGLLLLLRKLCLRPSLLRDLLRLQRDFSTALAALRRGWQAQIRGGVAGQWMIRGGEGMESSPSGGSCDGDAGEGVRP